MLHTQHAAWSVLHHFDPEELEEILCRLEHTVLCEYEDHEICPVWFCHPMRQVLIHADHCQKRYRTMCIPCKQVIEVVIHHARVCADVECCIPFCLDIRKVAKKYFPKGLRDADLEPMVGCMVREMIDDENDNGQTVTLNTSNFTTDTSSSDDDEEEWESDGQTRRPFVNLDWEPADYDAYVQEMRRNPPAPRVEPEYELNDYEEEEESSEEEAAEEEVKEEAEEEDMDTGSVTSEEPEMLDWEETEDI